MKPKSNTTATNTAKTPGSIDLAAEATLLRVKIHTWSAKSKCEEASQAAATAGGADPEWIESSLRHVKKKEKTLDDIEKIASKARNYYADQTSYWDDGWRLVTNIQYQRIIDELKEMEIEFRSLLASFMKQLPALRKIAVPLQGNYAGGFPSDEEILAKFTWEVTPQAITRTDDIRLKHVSASAAQAIEASTKRTHELKVEAIVRQIVHRIQNTLGVFVANMGKGNNAKWQQASLDNVVELGNLIPELNITNDPTINATARLMVEQFRGLKADELKKSEPERKELAKKAESLLEQIKTMKVSDKV